MIKREGMQMALGRFIKAIETVVTRSYTKEGCTEVPTLPIQVGSSVKFPERFYLNEILWEILSDECPAIYFENRPSLRVVRSRWGEPVFQRQVRPEESWHYGLSPYKPEWEDHLGIYEKPACQRETVTKKDGRYYDSLFGELITLRHFYFE